MKRFFAQNGPDDNIISPFKDQSVVTDYIQVQNIIQSIVSVVYTVFFAAAIFFILLAAYNFLIGGSDEKRIATAKNQLQYAVIAIVVALIAGGVSLIIKTFIKTAA